MENKRIIIILSTIGILLMIPLIAMQFSEEVNWEAMDFIVAGSLLLFVGLGIEIVLRKVKEKKYRIILSIAFLVILALVWTELAVGVFGSPLSGT